MSKSRLEKFLYALYSLDHSDLPTPLSRIEELYKCLVTGDEAPTFEPISRTEKYLMAILGVYDVDSIPNPLSRVEVLLYKLATGDDNLDDVKSFLSEHEELLAEIIRNGGVGGNIDIEYALYTLSTESSTLYNTAEKPVKSAILKGNTLVNLAGWNNIKNLDYILISNNMATINFEGYYATATIKTVNMIKQNTTYTLIIDSKVTKSEVDGYSNPPRQNGMVIQFTDGTFLAPMTSFQNVGERVLQKVVFTVENKEIKQIYIRFFTSSLETSGVCQGEVYSVMLIEGDRTNTDIPYFEGMQSVKMPVLTTRGKNLFPTNNFIECGTDNIMIGQYIYEVYLKSGDYCSSYVHADDSDKDTILRYEMVDEQDNQVLVLGPVDRKFTIENDGVYKLTFGRGSAYYDTYTKIRVQIEEGSKQSSYEPYKSNILTVNEDVELRGIGEVKDELDLVEGIHTKRIGVKIMDDTTSIELYEVTTDAGTVSFYYFMGDGKSNKPDGYTYHYCDSLPVFQQGEALADRSKEWTFYNEFGGSTIFFNIKQDKVGGATLKHIKDYLKYNPIKITYVLENEEVKTVDLSVVNQDGNDTKLSTFNDITHVTLSSEGLIPEAELEVATKNEEDLEDTSVYTVHTLSEEFNTLYNTAEKPVKSAILKGNTLVNIVKNPSEIKVIGKGGSTLAKYKVNYLDKTKNYTVLFEISDYIGSGNITVSLGTSSKGLTLEVNKNGIYKFLLPSNKVGSDMNEIWLYWTSANWTDENTANVKNIIVIEGDYTNVDIPYFEGMKSVKMPVLTTTGKNVCDMVGLANKLNEIDNKIVVIDESTWEITSNPSYHDANFKYRPIKFKENTSYTISFEGQTTDSDRSNLANIIQINYTDRTSSNMRSIGFNKLTTSSNKTIDYICFTYGVMGIKETISSLSIIEGESTSYEPYKSNILSTPQDLVLGGIGDVQDTLDLLTGEVELATVERGLSTLSNLNWSIFGSGTPNAYYTCVIDDAKDGSKIISDSLVSTQIYTTNTEYGVYFSVNSIRLRNDEATSGMSVVDFKNSLSSSTNKIRYVLAEKVVKTVDLSTVDQDGNNTKLSTFNDITHVTLSSEGLIPEAELEVAEKVPEVAANMLTISREQEVINATANEQSENVDSTMIATTEIYEDLL